MVTQLLFGECVSILDTQDNWSLVRMLFDEYECWIESKQLTVLKDADAKTQAASNTKLSGDLIQIIANQKTQQLFPIVLGSSLPLLTNKIMQVGNEQYEYEGSVAEIQKAKKQIRTSIAETAYLYRHSPYLWGGKTPMGIDCSGLSQMVYKLNGISIKRDAYQQAELGTTLSFLEEADTGDLAFFDNAEGFITHVGIILPDYYIIHASGKVRIDKLDHQGIFNVEMNRYTHNLRIIKNYID